MKVKTAKKLKEYMAKRDFKKTTEPELGDFSQSSKKPIFVIQKHDATNLHYDFRLEIDGVLVSWVIPKGPSIDPDIKRLAIRTEDHPLAYADFEGIIPKEEYGGGNVIIWDRGVYDDLQEIKQDQQINQKKNNHDHEKKQEKINDFDHKDQLNKEKKIKSNINLINSLKKGKIEIWLKGQKLQGGFVLIRIKKNKLKNKNEQEQWLLKKIKDEKADSSVDLVKSNPKSIISNKDVNKIT